MRRKCPRENRNPARSYGAAFELALKKAKRYVETKDQNYTILVAGKTGSGKSTIDLHMWDVLENDVDFERFGFTIKTSAKAYDKARKKGSGALFTLDELKLYARKSMSEYNTDFIDLLFSIRGQNLILAANAPSPRSIDKLFIEESLIDALIFIHASQARLLWITYDKLMKLLQDKGDLKFKTLKDYGEYYAEFDTYFGPVKGDVWKRYVDYKREGMEELGDRFVNKWGSGERYSGQKAADMMNVSYPTFKKWLTKGLKEKALPEDLKMPNGYWGIPEDLFDEVRLYVHNNLGSEGRV